METDTQGNVIITITLTPEQYKAMAYDCYDVEEWIKNAVYNKVRQVTDRIVEEVSDKQPKKITEAEKVKIVRDASIKSAKERTDKAGTMVS